MKKRSRWIIVIGYSVWILVCAGMIAYPLVSNMIYERRQDTIITEYQGEVAAEGESRLREEQAAATAYNEALLSGDRRADEYEERLDLSKNGIMGYLEIPAIRVELPVYHGVSEDVLGKGLGHVPQTTLPIGGAGTHAGITGHTGVSDRKLFSDLDQLQQGDWFFFHVLGEILAYQVEEILIVLPWETQHLDPIEGEDCITLITCTPFGINDHRLLIRGHRRELPKEEAEMLAETTITARPTESTWLRKYVRAVSCGGFVFTGMMGGYMWWCHYERQRVRRAVLRRVRKKRRQAFLQRFFRNRCASGRALL